MLTKSNTEVIVSLPSDREIAFTRIFERPQHLLFKAWTESERFRKWWGCEGSTLTVCEIDLRVGGRWHYVMRMADGSENSFHGIYREIVLNERLVYSECYDNPQIGSPEWLTTITFEEVEEGTRLTHLIQHRSREVRDAHLQAGMEAGTIQILNRLDAYTGQVGVER